MQRRIEIHLIFDWFCRNTISLLPLSASSDPLYLIQEQGVSNALIFTKSSASTSHLGENSRIYEDAYLSLIPSDKPFSRKRVINTPTE